MNITDKNLDTVTAEIRAHWKAADQAGTNLGRLFNLSAAMGSTTESHAYRAMNEKALNGIQNEVIARGIAAAHLDGLISTRLRNAAKAATYETLVEQATSQEVSDRLRRVAIEELGDRYEAKHGQEAFDALLGKCVATDDDAHYIHTITHDH